MQKTYKSKIDTWLVIIIAVAIIIPLFPVLYDEYYWIALFIMIIYLILAGIPLFYTRYKIINTTLTVRCGYLPKQQYDITKITKITPTNTIESSPAASLDRIAIYFEKRHNPLIISPKNKRDFIETLSSINPNINIKT